MANVDIAHLVPEPAPKPDYDATFLAPLRKAQAEAKARQEAIELARQAEEARQAELSRQASVTAQTASSAPTNVVYDQPADFYKSFIYNKESGNNPAAVNPSGCRGLGQACPGTKLPCGVDYACQDAYFTNYAMSRYGSWQGAYQFWLQNHWW